jgi:hypothetical protein
MNDISYTEQGTVTERFDRSSMQPQDSGAVSVPTHGFPRGRSGAALAPFQYADGPIDPGRQ